MSSDDTAVDDYYFYDPALVPDIFGMNNATGAMCWWNALMQVLLRTPALNRIILEHKGEQVNNLTNTYIKVIEFALSQKGTANPDPRINALSHVLLSAYIRESTLQNRKFEIHGQQSPSTEINAFLDVLKISSIYNVLNVKYGYVIYCATCKQNVSWNGDKEVSIHLQDINDLNTQTKFEQHILYHISVIDDFYCEKCNTRMKNIVRLEKLRMLCDVIILTFEKNNKVHWFPEKLAFASTSNRMLRYEAYAQIEHVGNYQYSRGNHNSSGHYYAKVRNANGKWYLINDINACPSSYSPTVETHMIFYHLMEHTPRTQEEIAAINDEQTKRAAMKAFGKK